MSRIGKQSVKLPDSVELSREGRNVAVKGPKGSLSLEVADTIKVSYDEASREVSFERTDDSRQNRAFHGLFRSLFNNMVIGVTEGYRKVLQIVGVGYRAALKGSAVELSIGYSDARLLPIPKGISVEIPEPTRIEVSGIDKQLVGQFAADIRKQRPPEPYKGKGIMYAGEAIRRKVGKSFAAEGT